MQSFPALTLQARLALVFALVGIVTLGAAALLQCSDRTAKTAPLPAPTPTAGPTPASLPPVTLASLGIRLAYVRSNRAGLGDLIIQNPDDSTLTVAGAHGFFSGIEWSPDGTQLAVSFGASPETQDIYVANVDGSGLTKLTRDGRSHEPTWSPDGLTIAFVAGPRGEPGTLMTMAPDGSAGRAVAPLLGKHSPAWAPDGSAIAVSGPPGTIEFVVPANGAETRSIQLLRDSAPSDTSLSWSPDSEAMAAVVLRGTVLAAVVLADGVTAQRQIGPAILGSPVDPASAHPSFAPGGTVIAASAASGDILAFDINTLPTDQLNSGTGAIQVLVEASAGIQLAFPAVSPLGGRTRAIT